MAIALPLILILSLGMIDLGIGVFRYNVLSYAARNAARQAIVHGSRADRLGPWGPATLSFTAADAHPIATAIEPILGASIDPANVTMDVVWVDGSNEVDNRVSVTLTAPFFPIMTFIFGNSPHTLHAESTMIIAH
jgi:Flp pilus assembly protein TadG